MQPTVLVLDPFDRIGLAIARGLAQTGQYRLTAAAPALTPATDRLRRLLRTRAVDRVHFLSKGYADPALTDELVDLVRRRRVDVLIPGGHEPALAASRARNALAPFCRVLAEDPARMQQLHDKAACLALAAELGIPHPRTLFPRDAGDLEALLPRVTFPAVVKARRSAGARAVWYARDARELLSVYRRVTTAPDTGDGFITDRSSVIVQEFIPGELHDAVAYCVDGRIEAMATSRRLVTIPATGGLGVVVVTTRNEPLMEHARRLVRHLAWNGAILLDFRVDERDGTAKLLEVNPRFWGSIWLTISAGLNCPHYWVQQALGRPVAIPPAYRVGLTARWTAMELESVFQPPLTPAAAAKRLRDFAARGLSPGCISDARLSDPGPTLLGLVQLAVKAARRRGRRDAPGPGSPPGNVTSGQSAADRRKP